MNKFQVHRHDMNYSHRTCFVDNDWNFFLGSLVDIFHLPIHLVMTTKLIQIIFCLWTHLSGLNASYWRCKGQHKNLEIELQCLFCRKREISISCKPFRILLKVGIVETKGRQSMHIPLCEIFFQNILNHGFPTKYVASMLSIFVLGEKSVRWWNWWKSKPRS